MWILSGKHYDLPREHSSFFETVNTWYKILELRCWIPYNRSDFGFEMMMSLWPRCLERLVILSFRLSDIITVLWITRCICTFRYLASVREGMLYFEVIIGTVWLLSWNCRTIRVLHVYILCMILQNCEILCTSVCMRNLLVDLHIVRPRHTVLLIGFPVIRKAVAGVRQRKEVVLTQGPIGTLLFLYGVQGLGSWSDRNSLSFFFSLSTALFGLCRAITARANLSLKRARPNSRINTLFSNHNMCCLVLLILNWDHVQISHHLTFQSMIKSLSAFISFYFFFFFFLSFKMFSLISEPNGMRKSNLSELFINHLPLK